MQIPVLLFGPQAVLADCRELLIEVSNNAISAGDLLQKIGDCSPTLAESLRVSRLAVNHEFADSDFLIHSDDEVALVGMVSGG